MSKAFVASAISVVTLLFIFTVATPVSADTIPDLLGFNIMSSAGGANYVSCDLNGGTGSVSWFDALITMPTTLQPTVWQSSPLTTTSVSGSFDPGESCSYTYSGTVDGITGAYWGVVTFEGKFYSGLTFTGVVTNGHFQFTTSLDCEFLPCSKAATGYFGADFAGFWSSGWHSIGSLGVSGDFYAHQTQAVLTIDTETTPEPSTLLMLGAGILTVTHGVRRTLRR
jgi:hypothetical protein